jgi:membrane protease YdiL (CAAX protease family)
MHNKNTCIEPLSPGAILRFLLVVFALGIILQVAAIRAGLRGSGSGLLLLTMWAPTVAAITTSRAARRMAWVALKRLNICWLGLGLLIGWAPGLLKALFLALSRMGSWDSGHFELAPDGGSILAVHHIGVALGTGPQSFVHFAINLLFSITLGSVVIALIGGVGEEIGWRVVLQPSLERRFGRFRGTCLVGLIWAYWHLPVNLVGYNDVHSPLLNALLFFPLGVVAMSFGLAWLTRQSKSVWPAALAHGANNTIGAAFLVVAKGSSENIVAELLSLFLVGGVFIWRSLRHDAANRTDHCENKG